MLVGASVISKFQAPAPIAKVSDVEVAQPVAVASPFKADQAAKFKVSLDENYEKQRQLAEEKKQQEERMRNAFVAETEQKKIEAENKAVRKQAEAVKQEQRRQEEAKLRKQEEERQKRAAQAEAESTDDSLLNAVLIGAGLYSLRKKKRKEEQEAAMSDDVVSSESEESTKER